MNIIKPYFEILTKIDGKALLDDLELFGRVCYKSEEKIDTSSSQVFIKNLITCGHESVIEHKSITVKIVCDRGISHEIVRHRIASYSQESTRYCNYNNNKFGKELTLIRPLFWESDKEKYSLWLQIMQQIEDTYNKLIELGSKPEEARSILPNSLKTEIIMTMNLREWRHFFRLRASSKAHPQMREVAIPLLNSFKSLIPIVFDDILTDD